LGRERPATSSGAGLRIAVSARRAWCARIARTSRTLALSIATGDDSWHGGVPLTTGRRVGFDTGVAPQDDGRANLVFGEVSGDFRKPATS